MNATYEEPEIRHERVQSEIMDWEDRQAKRERHEEPRFKSPVERELDRMKFVATSFHHEILRLRSENARLTKLLQGR